MVWVGNRGFQSEENRRYMQLAGGRYIFGEKLRGNDKEANAALAPPRPLPHRRGGPRVKEVVIDDGTMRDRFVICHNPEEARRDESVREQLLAQLKEATASGDRLTADQWLKLHGQLSAKRGYERFIRTPKVACCGSTAPRSRPRSTSTAIPCCEPQTQPCPSRTQRSATGSSNAPGAT